MQLGPGSGQRPAYQQACRVKSAGRRSGQPGHPWRLTWGAGRA